MRSVAENTLSDAFRRVWRDHLLILSLLDGRRMRHDRYSRMVCVVLFAGMLFCRDAQSLELDAVIQGAAVTQNGSHTLVTQNSSKAIIDWKSFSMGASETLTFSQPSSSSIALNRITGTVASQIDGVLNANGHVWILNPNGVMIGTTGQVNATGFLASTLSISNQDFIEGKYQFAAPSTGSGKVGNLGSINVLNGYAILAGSQVINEGVIQASLGHIVLAAGNAMTLDLAGDKLLNFAITQPVSSLPSDGKAAIENSGSLTAQGGKVLMTARAATDAMQSVINTTGIVEATSVNLVNGEIVLDGGSSGSVHVGGMLYATGTLTIHGDNIAITQSSINVLGDPSNASFSALSVGSSATQKVTISDSQLYAGELASAGFPHDADLTTPDPSSLAVAVTSGIALAGQEIALTGNNMIGATGSLTLTSSGSEPSSVSIAGSTLLSIGDLSVIALSNIDSGIQVKDAALLTNGSLTLNGSTLSVAAESGSTFAYSNQLTLPTGFVRPSTLNVYDLTPASTGSGGSSGNGSPSSTSSGSGSNAVPTASTNSVTSSVTEVKSSDSRLSSISDSAAGTLGSLTSTLGTSVTNVVDTIAKEGTKAVLAVRTDMPLSSTSSTLSASPLVSTAPAPAQSPQSSASTSKSDAATENAAPGGSTAAATPAASSASSAPTATAAPASAPSPSPPATPSAAAPVTSPAQTSATAASNAPPPVAPPPPSPVAAEKPPTPKDSADAGDKTLAAAAPPPPPKPASQARAPATQVVAVSPVVSTQVPLPPRPPAGASSDQRLPVTGNSARW